MPKKSREECEAEFEKLGPCVVQGNLENKVYLQGESGGWARAWLARKAAASQDEHLALARAAAADARAASQQARIANRIAAAALAVAIVAAVTAIIALWK
jgi:hypothetical protein